MARLLIVEDQPELAALIAAAARARGHVPLDKHLGQDALTALEVEAPFDAAIVDLLLPDIRGSEVLSALKKKGVPAFAVSGVYKGDRFAKEATEQHGARAFFEKPFDLNALLDAVEAVTGKAGPAPEAKVDELPELDVPVAHAEEPPEDVALPFADRDRVWGASARKAPRPAPDWARAGTIRPGTLARLLNAYYQARHTGELKLKHGQILKVVFFEAGQPVYAASNLAQERFARFCARRGVIADADMAPIAALAKESEIRTGEAMIQLGLVTEEQRRHLLEEQIKEIIWGTFGWTEGEYAFSTGRPARSDLVKLTVFPGNLILEGARREPLVALRKKLPASRKLFPSADPPYHLHEMHLGAQEAHLLVWADGSKTVEDLTALSDLSEREVLGTLYGFELLGILEERHDEGPRNRRISFGF